MTVKEKAGIMRAMADWQLIAYVESRVIQSHNEGFNQGISLKQKDIDNLTKAVIDMRDYIIDIGSAIGYTYYDDLIGHMEDVYTLTTKLNRR